MTIRVLVADEHEAYIFDTDSIRDELRLAEKHGDATARMRDRELVSDRPGRTFDRIGATRNRGAVARRATDGERSARRQRRVAFARKLARSIEAARRKNAFDRLIIVAGPRFLGLLRDALPATSRSRIAAEVQKDLVHESEATIRARLPKAAFSRLAH